MEENNQNKWSIVARAKTKATRAYEQIGLYVEDAPEAEAYEIFASIVNECPPYGLVEHCAENAGVYSIYEIVLVNPHNWHIAHVSYDESTMKRYADDYKLQELVDVEVTIKATVPSAVANNPELWDWETIIENDLFEIVDCDSIEEKTLEEEGAHE
jgi:hypothetical protein